MTGALAAEIGRYELEHLRFGPVPRAEIAALEARIGRRLPGAPKGKVADYMKNEARFRRPDTLDEASFARLGAQAQANAEERFALYQHLAGMKTEA